MTLRARLLLSVAGLVVVALVAAGAVLVEVTRSNLIEQVDRELTGGGRGLGPLRPGFGGGGASDPTGRRTALVLLDGDGMVLESLPSGLAADPDPLPDLSPWFAGGASAPTADGPVFSASSADGSVDYRVVVVRVPGGRTLGAIAAPLTGVRDTVAALVRNLILVGLAAVAAVVALGWILIRRDLRPIEEMAAATSRIADGDLDHRVTHPADGSEVGRLGAAFNVMLDRIQEAFGAQRASLDAKEASEGRLRRFVADASHELRTPLTSVRGYAELYRAGGLSDPEALERAMDRIETESRRMGRLVEDLLLLARLDQGRPLVREPVDLSAVVEDSVADARALEPDRTLDLSVAPGLVVAGDEDRLRQVIGNLLGNLRAHVPASVPSSVTAGATGDGRTVVTVADHGPGIPADDAPRVFDRFYRADPARSRENGGSGLGLAIAAAIVDAHGGTIRHRLTDGGGATFELSLPSS